MRTLSKRLGTTLAALALAAPWTASGCGGGGGSGDGPTSSVALLVGDAPVDQLSSFQMTITGLFLLDAVGGESGNLLAGARTVDLLALDTESCLLEVKATAPGTWAGARLAFDPASIEARDPAGVPVVVTATDSGAAADFAAPITVMAGEDARIHFDLPLDTTLADDPANAGQLIYTPSLVVSDRSGEENELADLEGRLVSEQPDLHTLVISLRDPESDERHGRLTLRIGATTELIGDDGLPFADEAAFYRFAREGDHVEADGALASDGIYDADRIRVERRGREDLARIFGVITAVDTVADTLTLRIRNLAFGHVIVERVLDSMGDPAEIVVGYANAEIHVRGRPPRGRDEAALGIGLDAKIDFSDFVGEPFPAAQVELEHGNPDFEGTIVDGSGLPGSFVVHLDRHDAAVTSGLVASEHTDVLVLLDGSETITLDVEGTPAIAVSLLADGLRVDSRGALTGPPDAPTIDATELSVRPGRLRGTVVSADEGLGTFVVDVKRVDDPFGGPALPDPVTIAFDAAALVRGDASTVAGFYALFAGLGAGEELEVEVDGLADGSGGAIAWRVEADVDD